MSFVIPPDHPSLPGHFPGRPLVPGVVLLDRVIAVIEAQYGALGPLRLPQVKFVQPLLPGESARIELDGRRVQSTTGGGHWGGGMFISARDMARFGYLFLRNGKWKDRQIVSPDWIKMARTPGPATSPRPPGMTRRA